MKPQDSDLFCDISGYTCVRADRLNKGGGGVCMYIRHPISHRILSVSSGPFDNKPEYIITELTLAHCKFLCSVLYRRPLGENIDDFISTLEGFLPLYDDCTICGDFNTNLNLDTPASRKLLIMFSDINLTHVPIINTHISANNYTTLDLMFTPSNVIITSFGKIAVPELSAHDLIYLAYPLAVPENKKKIVTCRDYSKINYDTLLGDALNVKWYHITQFVNINDKLRHFNHLLLNLYNKHAPLKTVTFSKPKTPWFTQQIRDVMKIRNKARCKFNVCRSAASYTSYIKLRNKVKQLLRTSFKKFMHNMLRAKCGTMELWRNLRSCGLVKNKTQENCVKIDPNVLNAVFIQKDDTNISSADCVSQYPEPRCTQDDKFYFKNITPLDVSNTFKLITSQSVGTDSISLRMLKPLIDILLPSLCHLFNYSLQCSCFPDLWKQALIKALPKIPTPSLPSHYRPISLLCIIAKMLEKIVYYQVIEFVNSNNLFNKLQSGFRKMHGTGTALLRILEDLRIAKGHGMVTVMVLLDYSKAFDTVIHPLLLAILRHLKFSEPSIKWFEAYLGHRQQSVIGDEKNSSWANNPLGVPQGSILGPLLYSLYTFAITSVIRFCKYHLYADDLQIYVSCKPCDLAITVAKINEDILRLQDWSKLHGLKINANKTQCIIVGPTGNINLKTTPKISVMGEEIPYVKKVKNLGIIIDDTLSFTPQVSAICQKVFLTLHHLYKFKANTPTETRLKLVKTLVMPLFDYCDFLYCDLDADNLYRLQKSQNSAVRYILDVKRREHITPHYVKLGLLKIRERHELHSLVITYKILQGYAPAYLSDLFTVMGDVRARPSRAHPLYLQAPRVGKDVPSKCFTVWGYRLWNNIPNTLWSCTSTSVFTARLTNLLAQRYLRACL